MDKVLDKYRQDFNEVRRLCLLCHGLDLTSSTLFTKSTYKNPAENTRSVLHGMLSSSLLNLAVAIRINIYQGHVKGKEEILDQFSASYYEDDELIVKSISVKDVCDKIIHADTVEKPVFPEGVLSDDVKLTFQFKGINRGKAWTLDLCLEVFTESVLKLVDRIELENQDA